MIKIQRDEQTGFDDLHYRMYENEVKMQKLKIRVQMTES